MTIEADILLARRLAEAAAEAAMPHFRSRLAIETKDDCSPVTIADRAAEAAMRQILQSDRPHDGIYGEEFGVSAGTSGRIWILDPVDGTRAFITGRPLWGTLIALVEDGQPILGLIHAGAARDQWIGCLVPTPRTWLNGQEVQVRPCAALSAARAATTHPLAFSAAGHGAFQRVGRGVADLLFGGDCFNYGMLAAGHLDLVMEEGLKPYDWAALVPVVQGAGGLITDWRGQPLTLSGTGQVLACGDKRVHQQALERI